MNENERLFAELITASRILVTVSRNAATVLSEEFESMITGPADAVAEILDKCPEGGLPWDGQFREDDLTIEHYRPDSQSTGPARGVRLTHKLTGLKVESYSGPTTEDNYSTALKVLAKRVSKHVGNQRDIGVM